MSTIVAEGASITEARDWFLDQRESDEGYRELTCEANITWPDGRERTIILCVTYFEEPGWHVGVQMQVCPDDDDDEYGHDEMDCPDCDGYGTRYADGGFCEVPCMCYCHTMQADDGQVR